MSTHICTVCFQPVGAHEEDEDFMDCGCEVRHFPPLCCPGCDCQSYELAHSEAEEGGDAD